ncbi:MAG: DUF61 family protein [Candidatus Thorarchaeota archaeon]|nr:DUF61 family protein [Candidatus Thorarchaeota archaeon]
MSRFIERLIENEIDASNDHLPAKRVALAELIQNASPSFVTRGGENSVFLKDEIGMLAKEVPSIYHDEFMLPIVLLRRMDLGTGIYTIAGSKTELFLISKVLGQDDLQWKYLISWRPVDRLARPQVQIVRRKLPSTTSLGFTTSLNHGDKPL